MRVRKAVIPVAGLGTRMLPATKVIPKELVAVLDRPAVQWVVESVADSGVTEVIFVTAARKSAVLQHFEADPDLNAILSARGKSSALDGLRDLCRRVTFSAAIQADPKGLGHAVLCAREAVGDEPFAVVLPDELRVGSVPALAQCLETAAQSGECVIGLERVDRAEVSRYGIVRARARDDRSVVIDDVVEKPPPELAPSDLAITGPYVLSPDIFGDLERLEPRGGGEIQLTDALVRLAGRRPLLGLLLEGERLDVGHPLGLAQANVALALRDPSLGRTLRTWLEARLAQGP